MELNLISGPLPDMAGAFPFPSLAWERHCPPSVAWYWLGSKLSVAIHKLYGIKQALS
jgi:hypothetical protein